MTAHRTVRLVDAARALTWAGDSRVVGPVAVAVGAALAWRARRWHPLVLAVAGWLALEAGARVLKAAVDRPRPPFQDAVVLLAHGSLPAAHVARVTFALALIATLLPRAWRRWFLLPTAALVVAVAWSRLELGAHWLTDTLVAVPLGLLAAWPLLRRQARPPSRPRSSAGPIAPAERDAAPDRRPRPTAG
jgi:undecaprenyl-diphosphatase